MKKLLMIILSVVLLLAGTLVACDKGVGEDQKVVVKEGIEYTYDEKEDCYVVTKFTGTQTEIVFESELNKKAVGKIAKNVFKGNKTITKITVPGSITLIDSSAFYNCTALKTVILQEGVSKIEDQAFASCTALTRLDLPLSLTLMERNCFSASHSLTSVNYPGTKAKAERFLDQNKNCGLDRKTIVCEGGQSQFVWERP